jgi:formylmethanofuran dehydrogenase subunit B
MSFSSGDPSIAYPRYMSRYAPDPQGVHVSEGRRSRFVIAVDIGEQRGPLDANLRIVVPPSEELDTLVALDATIEGATIAAVESPWKLARALAKPLLGGRYVAVVTDLERDRGILTSEALIAVVQALNGHTRAALSPLRAGGNRSGLDSVALAHTGFPTAIDFSPGYPRPLAPNSPLSRGDVDMSLIVGDAAAVPATVMEALTRTPCALVGPRASEHATSRCIAAIDTGVAGVHSGGTAARMDGVLLPLRPPLDGFEDATALVRSIAAKVLERPLRPLTS